jgi:hypothetical protein
MSPLHWPVLTMWGSLDQYVNISSYKMDKIVANIYVSTTGYTKRVIIGKTEIYIVLDGIILYIYT